MKCPLCDYDWPPEMPSCLRCEFDFVNNDARHAIQRLRHKNLAGNGMWVAGTTLVFLSFAALFNLGLFGMILATMMITGGASLVLLGLVQADRAKQLLEKAKERTKLPPARVL